MEDDVISKQSFSPMNQKKMKGGVVAYQGFKGLNSQLNELKKDYENDKMQVATDIIVKVKGLKVLK